MKETETTARITWLHEAWRKQADKIDALSRRWADLRVKQGVPATLFQKLTKMLDQVAFFREKERVIVSEIEAMEKKHRYMRENKLLRQATKPSEHKPTAQLDAEDDDNEEPKRNILTTLLYAWIFSRKNKSAQRDIQPPSPNQ